MKEMIKDKEKTNHLQIMKLFRLEKMGNCLSIQLLLLLLNRDRERKEKVYEKDNEGEREKNNHLQIIKHCWVEKE